MRSISPQSRVPPKQQLRPRKRSAKAKPSSVISREPPKPLYFSQSESIRSVEDLRKMQKRAQPDPSRRYSQRVYDGNLATGLFSLLPYESQLLRKNNIFNSALKAYTLQISQREGLMPPLSEHILSSLTHIEHEKQHYVFDGFILLSCIPMQHFSTRFTRYGQAYEVSIESVTIPNSWSHRDLRNCHRYLFQYILELQDCFNLGHATLYAGKGNRKGKRNARLEQSSPDPVYLFVPRFVKYTKEVEELIRQATVIPAVNCSAEELLSPSAVYSALEQTEDENVLQFMKNVFLSCTSIHPPEVVSHSVASCHWSECFQEVQVRFEEAVFARLKNRIVVAAYRDAKAIRIDDVDFHSRPTENCYDHEAKVTFHPKPTNMFPGIYIQKLG